jgi:adenylate cyclase
MEGRLAAILAADVVRYSRLMEQDEVGTVAAPNMRRRSVLEPLVTKGQGRILTGDGVMIEFAGAVVLPRRGFASALVAVSKG